MSSATRFFESKIPILLAFFVNYAILLSTLLIIYLFPKDTNLPLQLDNSQANFPIGSVTAIFSPDTQVFLDYASWKSWYLQTVVDFLFVFALFLLLNWNLKKRERGIRFVFYSITFLVLSTVANMLNVFVTNQSTIGPSEAFYSSLGLLVGFGLVNLAIGDAAGGLSKMTTERDAILFVLNGLLGAGLMLLSFANSTGFFSEVIAGYKVGYGIHIFCFYSAVAVSLIFGYFRRSSLIVPRSRSIGTNGVSA